MCSAHCAHNVDNPTYVHTTLNVAKKQLLSFLVLPSFLLPTSEHFLCILNCAHLFPTVHTCSSQCTCAHCSSACAQIEDYTHTMNNVHAEACKVNTSSTSVHILRVDTESCTLQSARLTDAVVVEPWNLTCDRTHISRTSSNRVVLSLSLQPFLVFFYSPHNLTCDLWVIEL